MGIKLWAEVTCDECGQAEHYQPPRVRAQAEGLGWITTGRRYFCNAACRDRFNSRTIPGLRNA